MAISVGPGTRIVFVGDSITADGWFSETASNKGGTNLLVQQLSEPDDVPRAGSNATAYIGSATGGVVSVASVVGGGQVYAINSGVGGNQAADIEAHVAARITDYNPDVVVIEVGINDCRAVPGPVTPEAFRASYDSIIEQTQLALPDVQIACMSLFCLFEQWAASPVPPHFSGNPLDSGPGSIADFNDEIIASAAAHGCEYIDTRAVGGVLESTMNTPEPGATDGVLTGDGIHPNADGQELALSNAAYPHFVFTP